MRTLKTFAAMLGATLLAALAVPAAASAAPSHESYSLDGVMATAMYFSETEPEVGYPGTIYVMGADAQTVTRVPGAKPVKGYQPSLVAMSMLVPSDEPGGEPFPAEVWGIAEDAAFSVARDLSSASLEFTTLAEVVVWDPETEQEVPLGMTMELSVVASWTGVGELAKDSFISRYSEDGVWTMDHSRGTHRMAEAVVTITGPDGVLFDGMMTEADISDVTGTSKLHMR